MGSSKKFWLEIKSISEKLKPYFLSFQSGKYRRFFIFGIKKPPGFNDFYRIIYLVYRFRVLYLLILILNIFNVSCSSISKFPPFFGDEEPKLQVKTVDNNPIITNPNKNQLIQSSRPSNQDNPKLQKESDSFFELKEEKQDLTNIERPSVKEVARQLTSKLLDHSDQGSIVETDSQNLKNKDKKVPQWIKNYIKTIPKSSVSHKETNIKNQETPKIKKPDIREIAKQLTIRFPINSYEDQMRETYSENLKNRHKKVPSWVKNYIKTTPNKSVSYEELNVEKTNANLPKIQKQGNDKVAKQLSIKYPSNSNRNKTINPSSAIAKKEIDFIPKIKNIVSVNTNGGFLNIRELPLRSATIVGKIPNDSLVRVIDQEDNWLKITFTSKTLGWINKNYSKEHTSIYQKQNNQINSYLSLKEGNGHFVSVKTNGASLNIRDLPFKDSKIIGKLQNGSTINVINQVDNWFKVVFTDKSPLTRTKLITQPNKYGWIHKNYTKEEKPFVKSFKNNNHTKIDQKVKLERIVSINTNGGPLNIRNLPLVHSSIIGKLPNGSTARVVDEADNWLKITFTNKFLGWINKNFTK